MEFAAIIGMKTPNAAKLTLACLLFALPASSAFAGHLSAVINGKSFHIDSTHDWNEDNVGIGFEYQFSSQSRWKKVLMVNGFRDSTNSMSYMAGGGLHRTLFSTHRLNGFYIDAGINAFLMTRHDFNDNKPFPGALPSLTIGNDKMGFNVAYLPAKAVEKTLNRDLNDPTVRGIVFVQFKISIDQLLP